MSTFLRLSRRGLLCLVAAICVAWAFGALFYDFAQPRQLSVWAFGIAIVAVLGFVDGFRRKLGLLLTACGLVLTGWLFLRAHDDRAWQPDVAETASAEINGDEVTLHNVRNCEYRTESDYTPRWETRVVRLSELRAVDVAITYWGSPWIAHPLVSFDFADALPVCFSIETRKEVGESYSTIGGIYRQYELIYIVADERDVLRLRTNYRKREDVYLYRTAVTPEHARVRFLEYLQALNSLHQQPRWYNAIATNCTTAIRSQRPAHDRLPWDWRLLLNGKADEMLFANGMLATGGLPFDELKRRSLINVAARSADSAPDFSNQIRAGLPGFQ